MSIIARLMLALVIGLCLAIAGSIAGWYAAFSLPESLIAVPFMTLMTGAGAGIGSHLGWRIDLDGSPSGRGLPVLIAAIALALVGAWLGFTYGQADDGSRVWRYPVTQATILGALIGCNAPLFAWRLIKRPPADAAQDSERASEYFQALKDNEAGRFRQVRRPAGAGAAPIMSA